MADDGMKEVVDTISVATDGVGALAGLLPAVAAVVYNRVDRYTHLGN